MKRYLSIAAFTLLTILCLAGTMLGTMSWFVKTIDESSPANIHGYSLGAYFAYGNGKPYNEETGDRPYGIRTARHVANLAWLQLNGEFNKGEQVYFEIADNAPSDGIDMSGVTLPPIGTETNPFVGNFDGNGKIIKNVTVSNKESDLFSGNKYNPERNLVSYSDPEIIGFFGVVGDYNGNYASYDSAVNTIDNLGLSNITIESKTQRALAGVVAGYVDAPITNVAVTDGELNIRYINGQNAQNVTKISNENIDNISDYSIIGYCTDEYKAKVRENTNEIYGIDVSNKEFVVNDDGTTSGLGGSINMTDLFNRINKIRTSTSKSTFAYRRTTVREKNTEALVTSSDTNTLNAFRIKNDVMKMGTYALASDNDSTEYMYLTGGHYETGEYLDHYNTSVNITGTRIHDGLGNYLTAPATNDGAVYNAAEGASTVWTINGTDSVTLSFRSGNATYYLRYNNGLIVTNQGNQATTFTVEDNGNGGLRYVYNNSFLCFDGAGWTMLPLPSEPTAPVEPRVERPTSVVPEPEEPTLPDPGTEPAEPGQAPQQPLPPSSLGNQFYVEQGGTYYFLTNNNGNPALSQNVPSSDAVRYENKYIYIGGVRLGHPNGAPTPTIGAGENTSDWQWEKDNNRYYYTRTESGCMGNSTTYYCVLTRNGNNIQISETSSSLPTASASTNQFKLVEWALTYKGEYKTMSDATTEYNSDSSTYSQRYREWQEYYQWYYTDGGHQQWVDDKAAYDAAWAQYDIDLAAYNAYVSARDAWIQYDTDLAIYNQNYDKYVQDVIYSYRCLYFTQYTNENIEGPEYVTSGETYSGMRYDANDTTYIPLNVVEDGTQSDFTKYYPKDTNTGYIISGASPYTSAIPDNKTAQANASTRVSRYGISNISFSYPNPTSTKDITNVYTVRDDMKIQKIGDGYYDSYEKFDDTLPKLQEILEKNSTYVFGLHFIAGTISQDDYVVPKYALINGKEYTYKDNYQLPVNSIDFSLKEKGFINFFAGLYFPGNDSFFSLHQIRRNADNTIAEIKEISAVLSDGIESHSYVYEYSTYVNNQTIKTYSTPFIVTPNGTKTNLDGSAYNEATSMSNGSVPNGYNTVLFNTKRITNLKADGSRWTDDLYWPKNGDSAGADKSVRDYNNSSVTINKSIYYFEIPMNIGEFALGSVNNRNGGYLFYLDIGANARKIDRTTFVEHFKFSELYREYPLGVAFVSALAVDENGVFVVDASNSASIAIVSDCQNDIDISRTGNVITVDGYDDEYNIGKYKHNAITLHDGNDPPNIISITPVSVDTDIYRMQYLDFNPARNELYRTVITYSSVSVDDGEPEEHTRVQQYNNAGVLIYDSDDGTLSDATKAIIYDQNTGTKLDGRSILAIVVPTDGVDSNSIVVLTYSYSGTSYVISDTDFQLLYSTIIDSSYYAATGYTVTITVSGGSFTITDTPYSGSNPAYASVHVVVDGYVIRITGLNVYYTP